MRSEDHLHHFLAATEEDLPGQEGRLDDFEMFQLRHSDRYRAMETEAEKALACRLVDIALNMGLDMDRAIEELPEPLTRQSYLETLVRLAVRTARELEENVPGDTGFADAVAAIADIGWYMAATGRRVVSVA